MTTKNAILLIVKQNPGIDYNSLLNKFAPSYSNANSARAALSRSLKDLTVFGLVERKENKFFLVGKGEAEIYSEIKNRLVLALNSAMNARRPEENIDSVVEKLQILIERGRLDKDLLKTSKSSLDFSISELETVSSGLEKKLKHIEYISKVFGEQIKSLKELDFNDSFSKPYRREAFAGLEKIFSSQPDSEFRVECANPALLERLGSELSGKVKGDLLLVQREQLPKLLVFLEKNPQPFSQEGVKIFSSVLKAEAKGEKVLLSGPHSEIEKWSRGG